MFAESGRGARPAAAAGACGRWGWGFVGGCLCSGQCECDGSWEMAEADACGAGEELETRLGATVAAERDEGEGA